MPRIDIDMDEHVIAGPGTFTYSAVKPDDLGSSSYTLVTMCLDISGSISGFADRILECVKSIVKACSKSEQSENLLIRYLVFNDSLMEIHGFKELYMIDPDVDYSSLNPRGGTALYDAAYSGIAAELAYAKTLRGKGFDVNGAVYIITDGMDNSSSRNIPEIKSIMDEAILGEKIESLISVLIGIKDDKITGDVYAREVSIYLDKFQKEANLTKYIDIGDSSEENIAKVTEFISKSISSQSNSLNTGQPSQVIF